MNREPTEMTVHPGLAAIPIAGQIGAVASRESRQRTVHLTHWTKQIRTLTFVVLLSVAAYFLITKCCLQTVRVVGKSMSPTLAEGSCYLLNRWTLNTRDPERREIVVIRDPADHGFSVKRIVAGPGDAILFDDGKVYVNRHELKESYLPRGTRTGAYVKEKGKPFVCGLDQYFVMGDNRRASIDSRAYGPVTRENILGLVVVR